MKQLLPIVLIVVLVLGILSGCGSEPAPYVPTGDGLSWGNQETLTQPTQQEEQSTPVVMSYYPQLTLNPYLSVECMNRMVVPLIYQGLFAVSKDYEVTPQLCRNYRVSQDMKVYTFYLMTEARFSDGDSVQPSDVVASLQMAMTNGYYANRFFHVKKIAESIDGGVTIELDCPYENLPILLDVPIVKKEQVKDEIPMGTGAYMLRNSLTGKALYRNPDWWDKGNLAVYEDVIPLKEAEGTAGVRDLFEFDDVSLVVTDPGSDSFAQYRCDYELWDVESGIFVYLGCNTKSGVFADKKVRSALTYAIDRDKLAADFYRGFAEPATLPASPCSPYYNPGLAAKYQFQSSKFAQAVIKAGVKGTEIRFLANSDDTLRLRVARAIGDMLTSCGLLVKMEEKNQKAYVDALRNREYDLYLGQTRLSPNMDLTHFFYEDGKLSFGPMNDETMYVLCLQALENSGNYYDLHQTILNDGRLCPVLFRNYAVYASWGTNWDLSPARDNVFYYDSGRTMEDAQIQNSPAAEKQTPPMEEISKHPAGTKD